MEINRYIIKAILDSKKTNFNFDKFTKKQLELICIITIEEYRKLKCLYEICKKV